MRVWHRAQSATSSLPGPSTAGQGPPGGEWFYRPGGGALFDLGVYNVTSLCGFLGSVRRVTALVGTAVKERLVNGSLMKSQADDNAQVLLDFGNEVYACVTTGFTIQKYGRAPATPQAARTPLRSAPE